MKSQKGFSLLELLVVVVILGIILSLTIIGVIAVKRNTENAFQVVRLKEFVDAQNRFKSVLGRRRFGSIEELCNQELLPDNLIKFQSKCNSNQVPIKGWIIEQPNESTSYLKNHFFVIIKLQNRGNETSPNYCVGDDGVLRKAESNSPTICTLNSTPVN